MCLEGFGLAQLAERIVSEHLQEGRLVDVLAALAAGLGAHQPAVSTSAFSFACRPRIW
jgi:hypothetical protein